MMHAFDQQGPGGAYSSSYPNSAGFMGGGAASWEPPAPAVTEVSAGPPTRTTTTTSAPVPFSFANIASQGYKKSSFPTPSQTLPAAAAAPVAPTVRIPQDLWNPHENRDSALFYIVDPIERYRKVDLSVRREDVIDLHFQSTKTFSVVLSTVLQEKLAHLEEVWIVTGTGHHVGSKTHQKGGGALESSVVSWLTQEGYVFCRGRDRNGQGGAVLVKR
jgi:DNA-nicking Smr family endonuclease